MRAVLQRVSSARVEVQGRVVGSINRGTCVFVGVGNEDTPADAGWLADKVVNARIFEDDEGKMNLNVREIEGALLLVSQFTLFGDLRRGNRPSFSAALEPTRARELFEEVCARVKALKVELQTGQFRAEMQVHLLNDGPVTLLLDSKKQF